MISELTDVTSLGLSLTDTLDDLINEGRIEPQLAMKILSTFDRVVTEVLADKVRARLTFKVSYLARVMPESQALKQQELGVACSID